MTGRGWRPFTLLFSPLAPHHTVKLRGWKFHKLLFSLRLKCDLWKVNAPERAGNDQWPSRLISSNTRFCNMDPLRGNTRLAGVRTMGERRDLGADFTHKFIEPLLVSKSCILTIWFFRKKIKLLLNTYCGTKWYPSTVRSNACNPCNNHRRWGCSHKAHFAEALDQAHGCHQLRGGALNHPRARHLS